MIRQLSDHLRENSDAVKTAQLLLKDYILLHGRNASMAKSKKMPKGGLKKAPKGSSKKSYGEY
jgi:hypothetical protein